MSEEKRPSKGIPAESVAPFSRSNISTFSESRSASAQADVLPTAIVMFNDDQTDAATVQEILRDVLGHDPQVSYDLMMEVHSKGEAVVAVRPAHEARNAFNRAMVAARHVGSPLRFELRAAAEDESERIVGPDE